MLFPDFFWQKIYKVLLEIGRYHRMKVMNLCVGTFSYQFCECIGLNGHGQFLNDQISVIVKILKQNVKTYRKNTQP